MTNVLAPIKEPFPEPVVEAFKNYLVRNRVVIGLFRVFANSLRHLRKGFVNLLDKESPLSAHEREIVILRVSANNHCEYEWGVHVTAFANHAQLTDEQIAATAIGDASSPCWDDREALLIKSIDELCEEGRLQVDTLARFRSTWTLEEQLEIFALAGNYHSIAFVANSSDLPLEHFAERFPTN